MSISSIIYLSVVIVIILFFRASERKRKAINIYAVIAIFLICIFAALRSDVVGTDTHTYVYRYGIGSQMGFFQYFTLYWEARSPIFVLFTQVISRLTGSNVIVYLFLMQFLTVVPIYLACWKQKDCVYLDVAMMVYLLLFFPASLNIMRECVSVAFMLYAWVKYKEKKYVITILCIIIAYGFHDTAIFFLIICILIEIATHGSKSKLKNLFLLVFSLLFFLIISNAGGLLTEFLFKLPFFKDNKIVVYYSRLQEGSYMLEIGRYGVFDAVFRVLFLIVPLVQIKDTSNKTFQELRIFAFIDFIIYIGVLISLHTTYGYRVAFYFDIFNILYLSLHYTKIKVQGVLVRNTSIIGIMLAYYFIVFVMIGANDVFPYTLRLFE